MALLKKLSYGIQAGIIGGLWMLGLMMADAIWQRQVWWVYPNLIGSAFYHSLAFSSGPGKATVAGVALQLTIGGGTGGAFRVACGNVHSRHILILLGTVTGLGLFFAERAFWWPRMEPSILAYLPEPATVLSHVAFGACLGYAGMAMPHFGAPSGPSDAVDL
jgi:hypothetical protein